MRRSLAWLAGLVLTLLVGFAGAGPARAASADVFDRFEVVYSIDSDGTLHVQETIVLRFGSSSGRHGLERYWITREPYNDNQDAVYDVSNIRVTSPDPVSTDKSLATDDEGRLQSLRLRVGDPDVTISSATATYVLSYDVRGAMRTFTDYDEFYWDVTGSRFPLIRAASVILTVPGGVQALTCSVAPAGGQGPCASQTVNADKTATYTAQDVAAGDILTVSAKLTKGAVANAAPILQENADLSAQRLGTGLLIGSVAGAAIVPFLGWLYYRRRRPDRRYAGLAPGTFPAPNSAAVEVIDPGYEVPVAFQPPALPLADAGLLLTGQHDVRQTTATLVALAVNGAIKLRSDDNPEATLVTKRAAADDEQALLVNSLFPGGRGQVRLDEQGVLTEADRALALLVDSHEAHGRWFFRRGSAAAGLAAFASVALLVFGLFSVGPAVFFLLPLVLSVGITFTVVAAKLRRGQRTAAGRALTDQVEGFRTYLATAEADQLRFEEGEDIFSRYLPWAILFDLTERWAKVCEQLVAQGRLADTAPSWYYGPTWNWGYSGGSLGQMANHVQTGISTPSSSGTGFGGGSSFGGGGGFSGGGGGGGGGGSW